MTAPTPEQRALWRRHLVEQRMRPSAADVLALLDALEAAELERDKWQRRAEHEHAEHGRCDEERDRWKERWAATVKDADEQRAGRDRAEGALARVEAILNDSPDWHPGEALDDIRAALNGADA